MLPMCVYTYIYIYIYICIIENAIQAIHLYVTPRARRLELRGSGVDAEPRLRPAGLAELRRLRATRQGAVRRCSASDLLFTCSRQQICVASSLHTPDPQRMKARGAQEV